MNTRCRTALRVVSVALVAVLAACGSSTSIATVPTATPAALPSPTELAPTAPPPSLTVPSPSAPSAATLAPTASPTTTAGITVVRLVGWRAGRVVIEIETGAISPGDGTGETASTALYEFDPGVGHWLTIPLPAPFNRADALVTTDGAAIGMTARGSALIIDAANAAHVVKAPATAGAEWGNEGLVPLPQGGFAVVGADAYDTFESPAWVLSERVIPHPYVMVAPTNRHDDLVLAPAVDRGLLFVNPYRLTLWDPSVPVLARLTTYPRSIRVDPSNDGLVYARTGNGWVLLRSVDAHGAQEERLAFPDIDEPHAAFESLSPSGRIVSITCNTPSVGYRQILTGGCQVRAGDATATARIDAASSDTVQGATWSPDDRLAIVASDGDAANASRARLVYERSDGTYASEALPGFGAEPTSPPSDDPGATAPPSWAADLPGQLDCSGPPQPIGAVAGQPSPGSVDDGTPDAALHSWIANVARDYVGLPLAGYVTIDRVTHWVLFGQRVEGRAKMLVLASDIGTVPVPGRWTVTMFAACDASEFDPSIPLSNDVVIWSDAQGRVPTTRVVEQADCSGGRMLRLDGRLFVQAPPGSSYDRSQLETTYAADVRVPASASVTAYHSGARRLSVAADGSAAFVGTASGAQRWPRVRHDDYLRIDCN